jgi:hypothetical protein
MTCRGAVPLEEHRSGHPIGIRVAPIQGRKPRPLGLQIGDLFRSDCQIGAVCRPADHSPLPRRMVLRTGDDAKLESELGLARGSSPDPDNLAVFEPRRCDVGFQYSGDDGSQRDEASERLEIDDQVC